MKIGDVDHISDETRKLLAEGAFTVEFLEVFQERLPTGLYGRRQYRPGKDLTIKLTLPDRHDTRSVGLNVSIIGYTVKDLLSPEIENSPSANSPIKSLNTEPRKSSAHSEIVLMFKQRKLPAASTEEIKQAIQKNAKATNADPTAISAHLERVHRSVADLTGQRR